MLCTDGRQVCPNLGEIQDLSLSLARPPIWIEGHTAGTTAFCPEHASYQTDTSGTLWSCPGQAVLPPRRFWTLPHGAITDSSLHCCRSQACINASASCRHCAAATSSASCQRGCCRRSSQLAALCCSLSTLLLRIQHHRAAGICQVFTEPQCESLQLQPQCTGLCSRCACPGLPTGAPLLACQELHAASVCFAPALQNCTPGVPAANSLAVLTPPQRAVMTRAPRFILLQPILHPHPAAAVLSCPCQGASRPAPALPGAEGCCARLQG